VTTTVKEIQPSIYTIRGQQVMLDNDLSSLYQIETYNLNKAVKRNMKRFPPDFMFQLLKGESESLTFQSGISKMENRGGRRSLPFCFTQEGVAMLSSVLNTDRAVEVNIAIMRSFVKHKQDLDAQRILKIDLEQLVNRLERMETKLDRVQSMTPENPKSLESVLTSQRAVASSIASIMKAVSTYYALTIRDLLTIGRTKRIVLPRQIAIYLIRKHAGITLKEIAEYVGGKDHTTILHACRKIEMALTFDEKIRNAVIQIQNHFLN
jgi:hypothetical protein